jgi:ribonuclease Z
MSKLSLTVLGSSSAKPTLKRNPAAYLLKVNDDSYLFDCGEGTQLQLMRYGFNFNKIRAIFITHLHLDHIAGLTGLISTMSLLNRLNDLAIFAPEGLKEIIEIQFKHTETRINYQLNIHTVNTEIHSEVFAHKNFHFHTVPLSHRIACCGYVVRDQNDYINIRAEKADLLKKLPIEVFKKLKAKENYTDSEGNIYKWKDYTIQKTEQKSFAYISDTLYLESITDYIKGVSLLFHEATFESGLETLAEKTMHSTAKQAALIAKKAKVKKLLIGHFSSRYKDTDQLLSEAKKVFSNTTIAVDGKTIEIE